MDEITLTPIGVIHSPFTDKAGAPIQSARSQASGEVLVYPQYSQGLQDLDGFSHIFLIYYFHCSVGYSLLVKPFLDHNPRGLFATRHPCRPNPLGLSVVKLLERKENILKIEGVDVLDGTPLLDIKPYVPEFDHRSAVHTGWYEIRSKERSS